MANRIVLAAGVALLVLTAFPAPAAEYYASPSNAGYGGGTLALPFKFINDGIRHLKPGDVLHLAAGTYNESVIIPPTNGTEQAPITIRGDPGAKIVGTTHERDGIMFYPYGSSYIIFEGLDITGGTRAGMCIGGVSYVTVRNCNIHDNGNWGIITNMSEHVTIEDCDLHGSVRQHGIYFSTTHYPVARHNRIYDNRDCGIQLNGDFREGGDGMISHAVIEGNIIHDCGQGGGAAINMDGAEFSLICNNLLYNNKAGGIVSFCGDAGHAGAGNKILYNTVLFQPGAGRYGLRLASGVKDHVIQNNIFICGRGAALEIEENSTEGLVSDCNIWVQEGGDSPILLGEQAMTLSDWQAKQKQDAHSRSEMPAFKNIEAADFHLKPGSPGLHAGRAVSEVATDLEGIARPHNAAPDLGAFQTH
jgi:hypothetical protein